eukprot:COSAG04_NODE_3233_length_3020_cov_4.241356_3_plen_215_part_00
MCGPNPRSSKVGSRPSLGQGLTRHSPKESRLCSYGGKARTSAVAAGWPASAVVGSSGPLMPSARSGSAWPFDCRCALSAHRLTASDPRAQSLSSCCFWVHSREMMESKEQKGCELNARAAHSSMESAGMRASTIARVGTRLRSAPARRPRNPSAEAAVDCTKTEEGSATATPSRSMISCAPQATLDQLGTGTGEPESSKTGWRRSVWAAFHRLS